MPLCWFMVSLLAADSGLFGVGSLTYKTTGYTLRGRVVFLTVAEQLRFRMQVCVCVLYDEAYRGVEFRVYVVFDLQGSVTLHPKYVCCNKLQASGGCPLCLYGFTEELPGSKP